MYERRKTHIMPCLLDLLNTSPSSKATWGICEGTARPYQLPPSGETLGFSLQLRVNRLGRMPMGEPRSCLILFRKKLLLNPNSDKTKPHKHWRFVRLPTVW